MTAAGVLFAAFLSRSAIDGQCRFDGLLLLDQKAKSVVSAKGYAFAEKSRRYALGLFAENRGLANAWENLPQFSEKPTKPGEVISPKGQIAIELGEELVEYFFIEQLSLHLSEFFDSSSAIGGEVVTSIRRSDVPEVLMNNRFIDQFSKPMNEREQFSSPKMSIVKISSDGTNTLEEVVYAESESGAVFDHFHLSLPRNASFRRLNHGSISIKTPLFSMIVKSEFTRFMGNIDIEFSEYYLGKPWSDILPCKCKLDIKIRFSLLSLLSPARWTHHVWIDSFLDRLSDNFSFESYLEKIQWRGALTMLRVNRTRRMQAETRDKPIKADAVAEIKAVDKPKSSDGSVEK